MPVPTSDLRYQRGRSASPNRLRRRRRAGRVALLLSAVVLTLVVALAVVANRQVDAVPGGEAFESTSEAAASSDRANRRAETVVQGSRSSTRGAAGTPFASVEGMMLKLPHKAPAVVAFHEASLVGALEMVPVGTLLGNHNPTKFAPRADDDGAAYHVLASRGRTRPATSAADIVVPAGSPVLAPVTGTVTEVLDYPLYGGIDDYRIVIESEENPGLAVVVIHLEDPAVSVGDRVVAGSSVLATVRQLPLDSQVDALVGERSAHVHLEVKAARPPAPVDPNAPAVEPTDDS